MPTGGTLRDSLQSAYRQSGVLPEQLDTPPAPASLAYLLSWFNELHAARGSSGFGHNPISYAEIWAWARLTRRNVTAFEVDALRELDMAFMTVRAKSAAQAAASTGS